VDGHEEGQGNPKVEAAIDPKNARSLVGLADYYHHFLQDFFLRLLRPFLTCWEKQAISIVG
jgi:hypothetical protein